MKKGECAVFGCPDRSSNRHTFPNPEVYLVRFKLWLESCSNDRINKLPMKKIFQSHRVCHRHFLSKDISRNGRLFKSAIPRLHLPDVQKINSDAVSTSHEVTQALHGTSTDTVDCLDEVSSNVSYPSTVVGVSPRSSSPKTKVCTPHHNNFSNAEMRDMVCVYAQENYCGHAASRKYLLLYPNREQPQQETFKNLYDQLADTGGFYSKLDAECSQIIAVDQENDI